MSKGFPTVGLIGRQGTRENICDTLVTVLNYLQSTGTRVLVEEETACSLQDRQCDRFSRTRLQEKIDLLIVVGGDGSLINAAHSAVKHAIPVLGINRGRLGFLTDIHPQDLEEKIGEVMAGRYQEEERFLLHATVTSPHEEEQTDIALNEVVLMPGNVARMVTFSITIDEQFVCVQQADGLIVATPTGSTAYALSGGGPILHPQLHAIVLVPMFPHTLSARPIVVSSNSCLTVRVHPANLETPWLSCDGQTPVNMQTSAVVTIRKYERALRLIHPLDYNYFDTLRTKLHWNKNTHNK